MQTESVMIQRPANGYRRTGLCASVCLLIACAFPVANAQSGLQRLFTEPALRAELDRRRLSATAPAALTTAPVVAIPVRPVNVAVNTPPPDTIYALGGSMRRSDGSYTIWINNAPLGAAELPANMELLQPYSQGRIQIRNQDTGRDFILKPGQVLNLTRGELMESYEYRAQTAAAAAAAVAAAATTATTANAGTNPTTTNPTTAPPAAINNVNESPAGSPRPIDLIEQAQAIRVDQQ